MIISPRTFTLEWEPPHALAGLVVKVRSSTVEYMESIEELSWSDSMQPFLDHVVEWNLEFSDPWADGDGRSTRYAPISLESLRRLEPAVVRAMQMQWLKAAWGSSTPLDSGAGSTSGPGSPDTAPMEPSSLQLASLSESLPN